MTTSQEAVANHFPDPTEVGEGGFAKSKGTRTRILEAALDVLAERGYAATSMPAVAQQAKLSRTAMLHHFPSRQALIGAVVQYVMRRRVDMQEELQAHLPHDEQFRARSVDSTWEQLQTKEFNAFCELSMAARTDAELAGVFRPALAAFDQYRREMALRLAEPAVASSPVFDLRRDLHRFLLEGMAQQDGITFNKEERMGQLFAFLKLAWSEEGEAFLARALDEA
ncbi:MAG: helix-turn-helix domain-containing protein [Pseudomonadota bacterium]